MNPVEEKMLTSRIKRAGTRGWEGEFLGYCRYDPDTGKPARDGM